MANCCLRLQLLTTIRGPGLNGQRQEPIRIYCQVTTATNSFEVVASLPHICPLFSSICLLFSPYHLGRTELQEIPASSTLACKYIVGHFFVPCSFLLHSTHQAVSLGYLLNISFNLKYSPELEQQSYILKKIFYLQSRSWSLPFSSVFSCLGFLTRFSFVQVAFYGEFRRIKAIMNE